MTKPWAPSRSRSRTVALNAPVSPSPQSTPPPPPVKALEQKPGRVVVPPTVLPTIDWYA
eukprot:CAMPEP_0204382900 /NCGR_PEP_ID=MMETSP0469-20131031/55522_1 /ASSEMBLY_ACC=CAM_ASM_000384 /TAXON_ID=2969 /ORGANISM="Oxyrrhis marina" /LENGTH=58 /DNA_ID=CAMNT_0051375103 /DNA_START=363 /DNA_END=539 /DNA_ORIENTATION=-